MSAVELLQPILDGGLHRNNFFNGRLLSAEDLRAEQDANRAQHRQLARAAGDGVAWGLGVSVVSVGPDRPRVLVKQGLALNRLGDLVRLAGDAEVTLVPDKTAVEATAGLFAECEPPRASAALTGEGAYVLVITPTSGYEGTALVSDPNTTAAGRGACGARFSVEGVRFRLVPMALAALEGIGDALRDRSVALLPPADIAARERLRNLLAHLCFGTQPLAGYFADPLKLAAGKPAWAGWGALDAMRNRGDLTDCDVPLAIVVLTSAGISFIDMWAARRKLVDAAAIHAWRGVAGPRRVAEGEAAFLQFQSQLEAVKGAASAPGIVASNYFALLPAGGWLSTGTGEFDWGTFLGAHAPPAVTPVDAALLRGILQRSWFDEPFALDTDPPVPLRVYQVPNAAFVVFARSANGNIRVFLSPAPAAGQTVEATATAQTGALTRATTRNGGTVPIPDLAPGRQTVAVTAPDYLPVAARDADVVGGRTVDLAITLTPLPNGTILVTAIDKATGTSLGAKVSSITATGGGQTRNGVLQAASGKWLISDLPAATYTLSGIASGYKVATAGPVGPTAKGVELPATLIFEPDVRKEQPSPCVKVGKIARPPLDKVRLCMVLAATEFEELYYYGERPVKLAKGVTTSGKYRVSKRGDAAKTRSATRYTTANGEIVYTRPPWKDMVPLEPETDEVRKWLQQWRDWFADDLGDGDIRKSTPMILLDPRYRPATTAKEVADGPPGYAVFAGFGVPLAIKLENGLTIAPVLIEKAHLPGVPKETIGDLYDAGVRYIDDLGWAWGELIADATGDAINPVRYLIADAGTRIKTINDQRLYYEGVDESVDKILKDAGINDDVALANANSEELGAKLGSQGFAVRLIEQARSIVPADSWSLENLPLTDNQMGAFTERGIDSKGMLARSAGEVEGKAAMSEILGLGDQPEAMRDAAIAAIANEAVTVMTHSSVALAPELTLTTWGGVDPFTAAKLGEAGFASVDDLAAAEPAAVAAAANLAPADAEKLVTGAIGASRASRDVSIISAVSKTEEVELNAMFGAGKATLGAIAAKTPQELSGAFGGDIGRATALLNGVKAGLAGGRF